MGSYVPSKILARLERFILADKAFPSFVVEKIIMKIFIGANGAQD